MNHAKGTDAAQPWRGLFGLHFDYAVALSTRSGQPVAEAVTWHTNMHRLFGYGHLGKTEPAPAFSALLAEALASRDRDGQLDILVAAFAQRAFPWPFAGAPAPADRTQAGCFACEAPTPDGIVRIHFGPRDKGGGVGPLHHSRCDARRADMAALTRFIVATYPDATAIMGGSWLYNLEAYRRIFPPEFGASRTPLTGPRGTHGFSSWGQFVNHRGELRHANAEVFRANLATLDPHQPWLAFPMQVLMTRAPLAAFVRHYGI